MNKKKNQIEVLELEHTISEMKKFTGWEQEQVRDSQIKETVNFKIDQQKIFNLKMRKNVEEKKEQRLHDMWDHI